MVKLVQISAWNDSGGGYLHRLLDGHPALQSWPFELLLGRDGADIDIFGEDWFRGRYRWPRLGDVADKSAGELFDGLSDSELKAVLRGDAGAKHREFDVAVDLTEWRSLVDVEWRAVERRDQSTFLRLYIKTFLGLSGQDSKPSNLALGHCPCAILDAEEIWNDFPDARILHVVRRPEPGFTDMRRRHPSLDALSYATKWTLINAYAAVLAGKYRDRVKLIMLDDLLAQPREIMTDICIWLGIDFDPAVLRPTWRGRALADHEMRVFGGVGMPDLAGERAAGSDLEPVALHTLATQCAGARTLVDAVRFAASSKTEALPK